MFHESFCRNWWKVRRKFEVFKVILRSYLSHKLSHFPANICWSWRRRQNVFNVITFWLPRGLEDVLKTCWKRLGRQKLVMLKTSWGRLQDVFKNMSSRHLQYMSSRRLKDMSSRHLQDMSSRRFQDVPGNVLLGISSSKKS